MLTQRTYKTMDVLRLTFQAAPASAALHTLLTATHAVLPTAAMALATAGFVDTATAILHSERPNGDIYAPLVLLLLTLGAFTFIASVIHLVASRIRLNLQKRLAPAIAGLHAALDFKHIENAGSWELIARVSRDPVKSIMDGFDAYMQFMQIVVCVFSVFILIITQVWWAALVIAAFSAPMFWLSMRAGKKNYDAGREAEKFNRRFEYLGDVLTGREATDERTLFSFGDAVTKRWSEQYEAGRLLKLKVTLRMFLITKGSSLMLATIALLVALTLIGPVVSGAMSAGMFMGVVGAVFGMIHQLGWQMSGSLEKLSGAREYMKDLTEFSALSGDTGALAVPDAVPLTLESIEFRDVRFKYPSGENYILDGLSFSLAPGLHYAFVGKNGAGKTTITKLLTGLYTEYDGEILVNGVELRQYAAGALKAMFSVVYQDFAKYYIKLADNIALGDAAAMPGPEKNGDARVREAAMLAGLGDTIGELRDGLETPLGKIIEDGQDISGGQWQRVAIARSLIGRAPVKILDEPTAALDPVSESRVYEEFEKLMRGRTTVFISHRLGSTKLADEILVVDGGRIAERGTHDMLMETGGLYAEMYESQREWYL